MDINLFIEKLLTKGKKAGFTDVEIYQVDGEEFEVTAFDKNIDTYKINTNIGLSFRGIINGKIGYSFSEKFEEEDIEFLVSKAAENAAETENDVTPVIYAGSDNYVSVKQRQLVDVPVEKKIKDVLELERKALAYDERIESLNYCLVSTGKGSRKLVNSKGLKLSESSGFAIGYVNVIAKQGEEVKDGSKFIISSDYNKINIDEIVKGAANEALSKFGAKSIPSGKYKIILRHDASADLLATFSSIFSSDAAQKGLSLLNKREGEKIASDVVNIVDNPFNEEAPALVSFDDEGVAAYEKNIVEKGILKTMLYNIKTAEKDGRGLSSTGNGFKASYKSPISVSPTNFYIAKGERTLEEAIKTIDSAVMITELNGLHSGADAVSGDFSLAAAGYLIENGKIIRAVEQITVADNFYSVLKNITEVLSDFEFSIPSVACYGSPSIIIKEMAVAGE